ncbi:hypothetical protein HK100_007022, partial [Physocladia obscura]
MQWTDSGSRKVFSDFIKEGLVHWIPLLSSACDSFGVQTFDHNAFLGAGAAGRVFRVQLENGNEAALKIVSKNIPWLQAEAMALERARNTGVVATVVKSFTQISNGSGAAILISPVGKSILRSSLTEDSLFQIVHSLFILHSAGFQHGDP